MKAGRFARPIQYALIGAVFVCGVTSRAHAQDFQSHGMSEHRELTPQQKKPLHVWAWKDNPNGTFANWNPDVSCDAYNGPSN